MEPGSGATLRNRHSVRCRAAAVRARARAAPRTPAVGLGGAATALGAVGSGPRGGLDPGLALVVELDRDIRRAEGIGHRVDERRKHRRGVERCLEPAAESPQGVLHRQLQRHNVALGDEPDFAAQRIGRAQLLQTRLGEVGGANNWLNGLVWGVPMLVLLMGTGVALTWAPTTESIMGSLPAAKAGVGSAVNDTVREVGGALGIAVLGSVLNGVYRSDVAAGLPGVNADVADQAQYEKNRDRFFKEARAAAQVVDTAKEKGQPLVEDAKAAAQDVAHSVTESAKDAAATVKDTATAPVHYSYYRSPAGIRPSHNPPPAAELAGRARQHHEDATRAGQHEARRRPGDPDHLASETNRDRVHADRDAVDEDRVVRDHITNKLSHAGLSSIHLKKDATKLTVDIYTARPGIVIGKSGSEVDALRRDLHKLTAKPVKVNIREIKRPELDAKLVAQSIAEQLQNRVAFRRAMKRALTSAMRSGAKGCKIQVGGRLGGAEMARTEMYQDGRVPLHTLRADIDYGFYEAKTTFGRIGVKCWINKGEIMPAGYTGADLTSLDDPGPGGRDDRDRAARLGERNAHWKGGITPFVRRARQNALYQRWRRSVIARDGGRASRDWVPRLRLGDPARGSEVTAIWEGAVAMPRALFERVGGWPDEFRFVHEGVDLALVGAATDLHQCEGPILARVGEDWWFLASDGDARRARARQGLRPVRPS